MAVQTAAGTTIGISAATPATFDATGYTALNFTTIGEITDGGTHGRVYAEVPHNPIGSRGTQKLKGSFNEGNKTLQLALDYDDDGQSLAKVALDDDDDYSFAVTYPDGSIDYFQAKVMSFTKTVSTVDSIVAATIELSITTNSAGVGIVEVSASSAP
jgi:hypothetical protein